MVVSGSGRENGLLSAADINRIIIIPEVHGDVNRFFEYLARAWRDINPEETVTPANLKQIFYEHAFRGTEPCRAAKDSGNKDLVSMACTFSTARSPLAGTVFVQMGNLIGNGNEEGSAAVFRYANWVEYIMGIPFLRLLGSGEVERLRGRTLDTKRELAAWNTNWPNKYITPYGHRASPTDDITKKTLAVIKLADPFLEYGAATVIDEVALGVHERKPTGTSATLFVHKGVSESWFTDKQLGRLFSPNVHGLNPILRDNIRIHNWLFGVLDSSRSPVRRSYNDRGIDCDYIYNQALTLKVARLIVSDERLPAGENCFGMLINVFSSDPTIYRMNINRENGQLVDISAVHGNGGTSIVVIGGIKPHAFADK